MTERKRELIFFSAVTVICIWLAFVLAPCIGGNILDFSEKAGKALLHPFEITVCAYTLPLVLAAAAGTAAVWGISAAVRPKTRSGEEHGSAAWGDIHRVNAEICQEKSFPLTQHVSIGMDTHRHGRNLNIMVIGGSGAGKTRSLALPGIMECGSCSFVVTDPKGEILRSTGNLLKENGYRIRVLNLVDFARSDGYNPFMYIRDDKDVLKLISNLIRNTTPRGASSSDPFWEKAETALLQALMFYLLYEGNINEMNFSHVLMMLSYAEAKEYSNYKSPLDMLFDELELQKPGHIACKQYRIYRQSSGKTAMSINISLGVRLAAFNIPQISAITDHDDMDFGRLGEEKTAVFAIIPDNDTSLSYIVGMLYTQIIQELYYRADHFHGGSLPVHVRFMLDEFANVSLPEEFDKSLATMRSREMSATIIVQNLAQLKSIYKENAWETITGNCDALLYLGGNEQSTHEYVSKMLGRQTITAGSYNMSFTHASKTLNVTGRELLASDEVRLLGRDRAILFVRGCPPVLDEKYDLMKHRNICRTVPGGAEPYYHGERKWRFVPVERAFDWNYAGCYIMADETEFIGENDGTEAVIIQPPAE